MELCLRRFIGSLFLNIPMPKALKDILPPAGNKRPPIAWHVSASENLFHNINYTFKSEGGSKFSNYAYRDSSKEFNAPSSIEFKGKTNSLEGNQAAINETIYFFQKDLRPGKMVNLPLLITTRDETPFLPDRVAKSIPFSSDKLTGILKHFSLKPKSREADTMNETIRACERVAINGEEKFCATSFESFVDLSISKLGKKIELLSNELAKETKSPLFTIAKKVQNMGENELVCHKMKYPGAVFLCHSINKTAVYKVTLVGKDGAKAIAVAVCHKDTSSWNPKHSAFQILKVKPGTIPICHFLVRDTLVWVSN
ncbi:hypothetical protein CRYUN_Cryun11dG0082600 [Craigia yunnanensis]